MGAPLDRAPTTAPETWFVDLADRELDRAYRLAGLILGSFNDAEDATHDAFVRAWDHIGALRDPAGFQAWFDQILVNVCRDRMRRARIVRFVPVGAEATDRPAADLYDRLIGERDLLSAIDVLEADLRVAVILRFWADLTVDEIAGRLGIPAGIPRVSGRPPRANRGPVARSESGRTKAPAFRPGLRCAVVGTVRRRRRPWRATG